MILTDRQLRFLHSVMIGTAAREFNATQYSVLEAECETLLHQEIRSRRQVSISDRNLIDEVLRKSEKPGDLDAEPGKYKVYTIAQPAHGVSAPKRPAPRLPSVDADAEAEDILKELGL